MSNRQSESFAGWAILELLGHRRLAGYVREQEIAGAGFLRIDVRGVDGSFTATQFYPPSSVYCLTPTTEEIARALAERERPEPVHRWELPAARESETVTTGRTRLDPWDMPEREHDRDCGCIECVPL